MQRIGFQRFAGSFLGHLVERAGTEEIHHDRCDDHGEGRQRRFDGMAFAER